MLAQLKISAGIIVVVGAIGGAEAFLTNLDYSRKVSSVMNRAQVSADRGDMLTQVEILHDNLIGLGWTRGHSAVIQTTSETDLALNFKAVERIQYRLGEMRYMDRNGDAYQSALDDIRGTLREMPDPRAGMMRVRYWPWVLGFFVVTGIWGLLWFREV